MISLSAFNPWDLVLIAALNPAVIFVAIYLGRTADQWQKLIVAAFAASLIGVALVWFAALLGILPASGFGGTGGLLILQMVFGLLWAGGAYWLTHRPS